jgi:hypothetical protein
MSAFGVLRKFALAHVKRQGGTVWRVRARKRFNLHQVKSSTKKNGCDPSPGRSPIPNLAIPYRAVSTAAFVNLRCSWRDPARCSKSRPSRYCRRNDDGCPSIPIIRGAYDGRKLSTVSKYMMRGRRPPSQSWKTFLQLPLRPFCRACIIATPGYDFRKGHPDAGSSGQPKSVIRPTAENSSLASC